MAVNTLAAEAVERIISETGLDDAVIDRNKFAKDLELNRDLCLQGAAALKPAAAKQDKKNLELVAKSARKFLSKSLSRDGFLPREVRSDLMALIATTDRALERLSNPADRYRDVFKNRSTFDLLIGFGLRRIYEEHFGRPAGSSIGRKGVPGGPYMRFAEQALIELDVKKSDGKPYSRSYIARSLTMAKRGHVRNKS
jgi:hypothetical protein